jgi:hypothetical protein
VSQTRKSNHPYAIKSLGTLSGGCSHFSRCSPPRQFGRRRQTRQSLWGDRHHCQCAQDRRAQWSRAAGKVADRRDYQWVSFRGADRRNPVLLYIQGGPGYVSIPMSWWFIHGLEEYSTVVQWDQRATSKTYFLTDPAKIASTLTRERMIADTEEWPPGCARSSASTRYWSLAIAGAVF